MMRLVNRFGLSAALLTLCCTGAFGADGLYRPSAFAAPEPDVAACSYLTSSSCSDCEPAACEPVCDAACGGCSSCYSCRGCLPLFPCCEHGDAWTLQSYLTGDCCGCSNISYGGWISAGVYGNSHGAASNGPIAFRNVGDGFTVDQVWGYFEKAVDTGGCGWDWGMRADIVFGSDGQDTQAFGAHPASWDNPWDTSGEYGSAVPQLYGEVGINDLKIKMGHFYTIIGYEVVPATGNFFYSYAYTMYYAEPFTHTGVLAEYSWNDITFWGGWVNGWDTAFEKPYDTGANAAFSNDSFLGGASASVTEWLTLTYCTVFGNVPENNTDIYMQSIVADVSLTENLNYVLHSDWVGASGGVNAQAFGVNNYLFYTINDCWKLGTRFEWFRDDDGQRVPTGAAGDYYGLTCGLNWQPTANLRVRPELRYDWYKGTGALPFDNGTEDDQFSGGIDVVFTF